MAKYRPGQTSNEILELKKIITASLIEKSNLLKKIKTKVDIYPSLILKNNKLSLASALKWEDKSLNIVKCSWNTAHAEHNKTALKQLSDAIYFINNMSTTDINSLNNKGNSIYTEIHKDKLKDLQDENNLLRNLLAEVYRAYILTIEDIKDNKGVNETIQNILKCQANLLGSLRVRKIK